MSKINDWLELFPDGVVQGFDQTRTVILFKDQDKKVTLPIWVPKTMGETLVQQMENKLSWNWCGCTNHLLSAMDAKVEACFFNEIRGHHAYVSLKLSGSHPCKILNLRIDEALPICFENNIKYFAKMEFIERSREVDVELADLEPKIESTSINQSFLL